MLDGYSIRKILCIFTVASVEDYSECGLHVRCPVSRLLRFGSLFTVLEGFWLDEVPILRALIRHLQALPLPRTATLAAPLSTTRFYGDPGISSHEGFRYSSQRSRDSHVWATYDEEPSEMLYSLNFVRP